MVKTSAEYSVGVHGYLPCTRASVTGSRATTPAHDPRKRYRSAELAGNGRHAGRHTAPVRSAKRRGRCCRPVGTFCISWRLRKPANHREKQITVKQAKPSSASSRESVSAVADSRKAVRRGRWRTYRVQAQKVHAKPRSRLSLPVDPYLRIEPAREPSCFVTLRPCLSRETACHARERPYDGVRPAEGPVQAEEEPSDRRAWSCRRRVAWAEGTRQDSPVQKQSMAESFVRMVSYRKRCADSPPLCVVSKAIRVSASLAGWPHRFSFRRRSSPR